MPRTKLKRSVKGRAKISNIPNMTKQELRESDTVSNQEDLISLWLSNFERDVQTNLLNMKNRIAMHVEQMEQIAFDEFSVINRETAKKTMSELRAEKSFSATSMKSMMFETASLLKHLNCTTNTTFTTNKTKKPIDDEAGESGTTSGDPDGGKRTRSSSTTRLSRQQTRTTRNRRVSRSLSCSKGQKNVTIQAPEKKTPTKAMKPPLAFGMVTPKMKPNMPISVFRRPMQGEMAISMQGSPLLVSGVVTETCANVNIPLQDGKILSLQPSRGLRMSEIPYLDEETRQQLTTLRDNLNKVVKLAYNDD